MGKAEMLAKEVLAIEGARTRGLYGAFIGTM